jgi:hypothetical protein
VHGGGRPRPVFMQVQDAEIRATNARSVGKNGLKYGIKPPG